MSKPNRTENRPVGAAEDAVGGQDDPSEETNAAASVETSRKHKVEPEPSVPTNPKVVEELRQLRMAKAHSVQEEFKDEFPPETTQGMDQRETALQEFENVFVQWVVSVGTAKGKTEEETKQCCLITPIGLYRMGAVDTDTESEILVMVPHYVTRQLFFNEFCDRLRECEGVKDCYQVRTWNHILKVRIQETVLDVSFASLGGPLEEWQKMQDIVAKDWVLKSMDPQSRKSLDSLRVVEQMMVMLPNVDHFSTTLRMVIAWAKRRGIYGSIFGFLGDLPWAVLVAHACRFHPYDSPTSLLLNFFQMYDLWDWSRPVLLDEIATGFAGLTTWSISDMYNNVRINLMPIITPAYPAKNCASTVTATTKIIVMKEIRRAHEILKKATLGPVVWHETYDPAPFFDLYSQYLVLDIYSQTVEIHTKFMGYVETKLHDLLRMMENIPGLGMHPHPKRFALNGVDEDFPHGTSLFIALAFFKDQGCSLGEYVDLRYPLRYLLSLLSKWPERAVHDGKFFMRCRRLREAWLPDQAVVYEQTNKRRRLSRASP